MERLFILLVVQGGGGLFGADDARWAFFRRRLALA
jgi:hypothetical protein